jgi:DNA-binding NarL/FixJ family response regulator
MYMRPALVGRQDESAELDLHLARTVAGNGRLVLLAGATGVGKTRLASEALARSDLLVLPGRTGSRPASPFSAIVSALRAFLRIAPNGLPEDAPFRAFLPALLPELGSQPPALDGDTLYETILSALAAMARRQPTALFFDDLHEADRATLELLPFLAASLGDLPLLLLGAYRSDELRRDHPLRRVRAELRRAKLLNELAIEPLAPGDAATLLAQLLGNPASPALAAVLFERTKGVAFFVEELVAALLTSGRVRDDGAVWELVQPDAPLPLPESIRDLVLMRAATLSGAARAIVDVAAVAGVSFDLDLVAAVSAHGDALGEVLAYDLLVETGPETAAFRHALIRDAIYGAIPWSRRRMLHRQLAERLEQRGNEPGLLADHWLLAREPERARLALLLAANAAQSLHAYRDAADLTQRALDLWPEGDFSPDRLAALDRLGVCAQLCGELPTAVAAWRAAADAYSATGNVLAQAEVQRRLAAAYELLGDWEAALAAHESAADSFAAHGQPGDAASERLAAAAHQRSAARFDAALAMLARAAPHARDAARIDLQARILGLEGDVRARMGDNPAGVDQVRAGLALALAHDLSGPAAEIFQRLGDALEHSGDYSGAAQTYLAATEFCQTQGAEAMTQVCLACTAVVMRRSGAWQRCLQTCGEVLASSAAPLHARAVALGTVGIVRAQRGETSRARAALLESERLARQIELAPLELLSTWGFAMLEELSGDGEAAVRRCQRLLERWSQTEERHFVIPALSWSVSLLSAHAEERAARACAEALSRIVTETGASEAIAALGHALGELSLFDADPVQAARLFLEANRRQQQLEIPYESAQTQMRAGIALIAADDRAAGIEQLVSAYRLAHGLGARPLASKVASELAKLGEPIDRRLGRRAAGLLARGGLTRRELEVLHLVAAGHTDREIAQALVLSRRTVEMHVANCLGKLECRSRAAAVRRAAELRLFSGADSTR